MTTAASLRLRPRASHALRIRALSLDAYGWGLAVLTAAAAALRFSTLGVQSFWKDEAVTVVRILKPSLIATLSTLPHSEATPPLYYVLAWVWTRVFGTSEAGIRSLSALLGTAIVPVAYFAGARLVSRRTGLVAAAIVAFSPYLVWYSQEARAYALLALTGGLSFLLFLEARARPTRRNLALWAVASSLALATHYFAVFIVASEALWLAFIARPRERRVASRPTLVAIAAVGVVGGALLPLAIHQAAQGHDGWIHRLGLASRVGNTVKFFLAGPSGTPTALIPLAAGALVAAALWMLVALAERAERSRAAVALAIGGGACAVPLLLAPLGADFFFHRNLIGAFVPLAIVVGAGLGSRRTRVAGPAIAVALCAVSLAAVVAVASDVRYQRADWRSAARAIGRSSSTRAIVTPSLGDEPLEFYLPGTTMLHRGARVSEVDVIGWPLSHERTPPAPAGFTFTGRSRVGALTLVRYRASAPVSVTHAALGERRLGRDHPGVLLEKPRPKAARRR